MQRRDKELSKGWGQIAIPLLIDTAGGRQKINLQIQKTYFVSFNPFLHPRQNHLSDGWQKLDMNAFRKLKTLNLKWIEKSK